MTEAEAKALRQKWQQQTDPVACKHPKLELEAKEGGYLADNYHCTDCGEPVPKKL